LSSFPDARTGSSSRLQEALWPAGLVLGLGAEWLARSGQSLAGAAGDLAVGWALIGCGLIAWSRRPQSRIGILLTATGFAWFLGTLAESDVGAIAAVGAALLTLHRGLLFHAIVGYPSGRPSGRLEIGVVAIGYGAAAISPVGRNEGATLVIALVIAVTTTHGYFIATGPERQARTRAIAAAATLALVLGGGSVNRLSGSGAGAEHAVLWAYEVVVGLIAVGFLADLLRGRWAQAAVTKLVVDLGEPAESGTLRNRLAHALGDSSLQIAYWLPEANGYVDDRGDPLSLPELGSTRAVTTIERHGEQIAALVHEAVVLEDHELVDSVAAAAAIALSNVRLQADIRRQVDELAASRQRVLEAGDAQRRRLRQQLREGAEHRLAGVQEVLELAGREAGGTLRGPALERLEEAEREVRQAQTELRELADGIHPAHLTEGGLVALSYLAERAPFPVDVTVPQERFPPAVEAAIYFVCSETLANTTKHAKASRVTIRITRTAGRLTVEVSDDGIGGADFSAGSGLRGLGDRVEALGGHLRLESPVGIGTRILAEIPFGSHS
jgi:signal transduction histidine kinase